MNIEEVLEQMRKDANYIQMIPASINPENFKASAQRLADSVLILDEWLMKGGFLPADWTR